MNDNTNNAGNTLFKFDMYYLKRGILFGENIFAKDWIEAERIAMLSRRREAVINGKVISTQSKELEKYMKIKMN